MNYVKFMNMVIEVEEKETDDLFRYLWDERFSEISQNGAETDFDNDFGPVTHLWKDGELHDS